MKLEISKTFIALILGITTLVIVGFASAAWIEPGTPTSNDATSPIDISANDQVKPAMLGVGGGFIADGASGLYGDVHVDGTLLNQTSNVYSMQLENEAETNNPNNVNDDVLCADPVTGKLLVCETGATTVILPPSVTVSAENPDTLATETGNSNNGSSPTLSVADGQTVDISWTGARVTTCSPVSENDTTSAWPSPFPVTGTTSDQSAVDATNIYAVQCTGNNGAVVQAQVTVDWSSPPPPTPVVTLTATDVSTGSVSDSSSNSTDPTLVADANEQVTIAWSGNTTLGNCEADTDSPSSFTNISGSSGNITDTESGTTSTYAIKCTNTSGSDGYIYRAAVTVNWASPPLTPVVTLTATDVSTGSVSDSSNTSADDSNPTLAANANEQVTIAWSGNATLGNCEAGTNSPATFAGISGSSGSITDTESGLANTYAIKCTNTTGSDGYIYTAELTVNWASPPVTPIVTLTATDTASGGGSVSDSSNTSADDANPTLAANADDPVTIAWSGNATLGNCEAGVGSPSSFSGISGSSGSITDTGSGITNTYTINCTNTDGSAGYIYTAELTVNWASPPPPVLNLSISIVQSGSGSYYYSSGVEETESYAPSGSNPQSPKSLTAYLEWSTQNMPTGTTCVASSHLYAAGASVAASGTGWDDTISPSPSGNSTGYPVLSTVYGRTYYVLTCTTPQNQVATQQVYFIHQGQAYTSSATTTLTIPYNVNDLNMCVWGGGGGGGTAASVGTNGENGGTSIFEQNGITIVSAGGGLGGATATDESSGLGGSGGVGSATATTKAITNGNNGQNGQGAVGGTGGASATASGGGNTCTPSLNGTQFGHGGPGYSDSDTGYGAGGGGSGAAIYALISTAVGDTVEMIPGLSGGGGAVDGYMQLTWH